MSSIKLIDIIKTLSPQEFRRFGKYINSPFFNKDKSIIKLYSFIKRNYSKLGNIEITREKAYKFIYPEKKYNDARIRFLMAKLTKLLEEYLIYLQINENKHFNDIRLLAAISEKRLSKYFYYYSKRAKNNLEKFPYRNFTYYSNKHELDFRIHNFSVHTHKNIGIDTLQQQSSSLDLFYTIKKLSYSADMIQRRDYFRVKYKTTFLNPLLRYLKKIDNSSDGKLYNKYPTIGIHYLLLLLLQEKDGDKYYDKLKLLLNKHHKLFNLKEASYLYNIITNYLNFKIYTGDLHYTSEVFEIYKRILKENYLHIGKYISQYNYHNVASAGILLKKYNWVEDFLVKYKEQVDPKFRENIFNLEYAWLLYSKKEYEKAIKTLKKVEDINYNYYLETRKLLMRIYYETYQIVELFSLIDTFNHFLKRSKLLSENIKNDFLNYSTFIGRILKIRIKEKDNISEVKKLIIGCKNVDGKDWLLEKVYELEKENKNN